MTNRTLLFVGCLNREAPYFQGARGKGIAVFAFDDETGRAELLWESDDLDNPTFLSVHPSARTLYATSEIFGRKEGVVAAYRIDQETGRLDYLNMQPTLGSIAAYNSPTADGRFLLLANYGMGSGGPDRSVVVFPIADDGSLAPACASAVHEGAGPNRARQERAHAHCVRELDGHGNLLVADLGLDQLISYRLGAQDGLVPTGETKLAPGAGPRHIALGRGGSQVFVLNELDSTVQSFRRKGEDGLEAVSTCPAVPARTAGSDGADLHLSPDGRFLYASNRGHDSIAIFAVDSASAELKALGHTPTLGLTPRSFVITTSGRHLLVANQNSDEIVIFRRDAASGRIEDTGHRIAVGTPMCVRTCPRPGAQLIAGSPTV